MNCYISYKKNKLYENKMNQKISFTIWFKTISVKKFEFKFWYISKINTIFDIKNYIIKININIITQKNYL